jgi:hypothetical protein
MQAALIGGKSELGQESGGSVRRAAVLHQMAKAIQFKSVAAVPGVKDEESKYNFYSAEKSPFNLTGTRFSTCLFWV